MEDIKMNSRDSIKKQYFKKLEKRNMFITEENMPKIKYRSVF